MKILIIEPEKTTQSTIESVLLKNSPSHELLFVNDIVAGKDILTQSNIDLLIVSTTATNISDIAKQLKSIAKKLILTKALLILPEASVAEHVDYETIKNILKTIDYVVKPLSVIRLSSTIMDILTDFTPAEETEVLFLPVKIDLLKNAVSVPCDLFVKISERKYVKIVNKNQADTVTETVERYHKKGIDVLYVEKQFYSTLSTLIMNDFFCSEADALPAEERGIKITESVMLVTSELGAPAEVIESINESYTEVIKNLEHEKVSKLLSNMTANENVFIENHSYLTSVFAVMMSRKMQWGNSKIQNNICMAALLHDLVLADNHLGNFDKDSLEDIKKLPQKSRDLVINHPKILADKLRTTTKIPDDVLSLISKHHEGRGAESYPAPEGTVRLDPVNCLFNVAHQFSLELYKIGFNNMKLPTAFENLRKIFRNNSSMRSYIDLLEQLVKTQT